MTKRQIERDKKVVSLKAKLAGLETDLNLKIAECDEEYTNVDYIMGDIEGICKSIESQATEECRYDGDTVDLQSEFQELESARADYEGACADARSVDEEVEKIEEEIAEVKKQLKKFKVKKAKK